MVLPVAVNSASYVHAGASRPMGVLTAAQATMPMNTTSTTPSSAIGVPTPTQRQTAVEAVARTAGMPALYPKPAPERRQFHPNGAPSAVLSENFLAARALETPGVMHNMAAVRRVYTSNILREAPRFPSNINLVA